MVGFTKRSITKDIDVSAMRMMRAEGATNKQIAERFGVSTATVYKYLGKRSLDVAFSEAKNLPAPVTAEKIAEAQQKKNEPKKPEPVVEPIAEVVDIPVEEPKKESSFLSIQEIHKVNITGRVCEYVVDKITGEVTFRSGLVEGLLDKDSLMTFIDELNELKSMIGG